VQPQVWFTGWVRIDFNVFPGNNPDPCAQSFGCRFFGSKTDGKFGGIPFRLFDFIGGVDALQEAFTMTLEDAVNAFDFYQVDSRFYVHVLGSRGGDPQTLQVKVSIRHPEGVLGGDLPNHFLITVEVIQT